MNLESIAGSLGKELLKSATRDNGAIRKFAERMGEKILERASQKMTGRKDFGRQLQSLIRQHASQSATKKISPAAGYTTRPATPAPPPASAEATAFLMGRMATDRAIESFQSFDTNSDGVISREELTEGMKDVDAQLANMQGQTDLTPEQQANMRHLNRLHNMAQGVLNNYDTVAGLDGDASGLAAADFTALASQDGHEEAISHRDWRSVLT